MEDTKEVILAFDLYGTLLSTSSIAEKLASYFDDDTAKQVAATWRKYQLEYTWRLNSMGMFDSFKQITLRALRHALAEAKLELSADGYDNIMHAYDALSTFPDVTPALSTLAETKGIRAVVFSNGTEEMVMPSVKNSPSLAPWSSLFEQIIVVSDVERFKPHPKVYDLLCAKVGVGEDREQRKRVWLVSGNPFDVVGARCAGMEAAWVDRDKNGWSDGLIQGDSGKPSRIVNSLEELVPAIQAHMS